MNKKFTASEVRDQIAWLRNVTVVGTKTTYQMLDAFADLLEAQERAVPVVTRESAINAIEYVGLYNGPGRETEARQMLVEGSPSVAHHALSDAKRLADAVFPSHWACVPYENHPGKRIVGFVIDESHPWWGKCGLTEPLSALEAAIKQREREAKDGEDSKDRARYRHMIETSPFMCFGASEYRCKADLDEAIDSAMAKEPRHG